MKTSALLLSLLVASAEAFVPLHPGTPSISLRTATVEEVDFDAPVERAAAVGNVVKAEKPSFLGIPVPPSLAKAIGARLPYGAAGQSDGTLMELDDECYLGKDGNLEECADFDPPVAR